ncbi:MAG: class I SAM-dependent methyltransferase [Desulfomonile tiedjei]|nr:class I SAM-dependent methyltransferase [Desulfomonile tiedjei]
MDKDTPHKYEYAVDLNSDSAAAKIVRMVGEGKRVLEIGAGPGSITRILRDAAHCRVTAIEIDPKAIEVLTPFCERLYQADLNDSAWPMVLRDEEPFEVIVVADVLEHLYDPWSTLRHIGDLIADDCYAVISLPHAGHNAVLACLLAQDFEYRDCGLLDRDHIRFFGMKNIQALFDGAGLKIVAAQFVVVHPGQTEFAECWEQTPAKLRRALSFNRFGMVYQVVVKAVPSEATSVGISLPSLPVGAPPTDLLAAVVPFPGVRRALKARARALLSTGTRARLRSIATHLGIRF